MLTDTPRRRARMRRFGAKCRIGVCMTQPMFDAVDRIARDEHLDLSAVVRRLVARALEAQSKHSQDTEIDTSR